MDILKLDKNFQRRDEQPVEAQKAPVRPGNKKIIFELCIQSLEVHLLENNPHLMRQSREALLLRQVQHKRFESDSKKHESEL